MARQFGIMTNISGLSAGIVINDLTTTENAEIAECRDSQGKVTDYAAYSKTESINATGVMDTSAGNLVTAGSVLQLGGKNYVVESVTKTESNQNYVQIQVNAKTADDVTITAISSGSQTE